MQHTILPNVKGRKLPYASRARELEFSTRYEHGFEVMALLHCGSTVQLELESLLLPILLQRNGTNRVSETSLSVIFSREGTPIEVICQNLFQLLPTSCFRGCRP